MPFIAVGKENSGNIHLYYEDHGSGKPVVLIHGWPFSQRTWENQSLALLKAGYRVVKYDRRGFGQSSQPAIGYDYDTFAEDLNQLMTRLDLRDATLVGHSMGTGEVTRYLAKYGSERVERAVQISTLGPFLLKTPDNPGGVDGTVFEGIKKGFAADRLASLTKFCFDFFNADANLGKLMSEELLRDSWNIAAGASPKGTYDCITTWTTDFRKDLPKIDVPLLIIHGNADRILPFLATAPLMNQAVQGSRLVVIEGGSHGIAWTHSEKVNREILTFMSGESRTQVA